MLARCNNPAYLAIVKGNHVIKMLLILAALVMVLTVMAVFADPTTPAENDPRTNPDANACFTSGSMADKCGDSDMFWNAGWYLIRFEQSLINRNQVPDQYKWVLPKDGSPFLGDNIQPTPTSEPI